MKKRFMVGLDSSTLAQDQAFIKLLSGPYGWWHWLKNFWLIYDPNGVLTASEVRRMADEVYPSVTKFVIELRPDGSDTWSGTGPGTGERNMFKWIRENWSK